MDLTPHACREARRPPGWSRLEMPRRIRLAYSTIRHFRTGARATAETRRRLRLAFEAATAGFLRDSADGLAVRLRPVDHGLT